MGFKSRFRNVGDVRGIKIDVENIGVDVSDFDVDV